MATSRLLSRPNMSHQWPETQARTRLHHKPILSHAKIVGTSASFGAAADNMKKGFTRSDQNGKTLKSPHLTAKVSITAAQYLDTPRSESKLSPEGFKLLLQVSTNQMTKWKANPLQAQMFIERVIVNCRFFTLLAVAGSLLGSVLCFFEGCVMVLQSYSQYLVTVMSHRVVDQASIVKLVISAIDMFLVGIAMLVLGMGIYAMFIDPNTTTTTNRVPKSTIFSLFRLRMMPSWLKIKSISQAKTRLGHTVVMLLLVGVLEKFDSIPLATGFDLACFAAAILFSSASIFLLSKLACCTKQE